MLLLLLEPLASHGEALISSATLSTWTPAWKVLFAGVTLVSASSAGVQHTHGAADTLPNPKTSRTPSVNTGEEEQSRSMHVAAGY